MKIVGISMSLNRIYGGAPQAAIDTMFALSVNKNQVVHQVLGQSKHSFDDSSLNSPRTAQQILDYQFYFSPIENPYGLVSPLKFLRAFLALRKFEPDVIIVHQIYTLASLLGWFGKIAFGCNLVIVPHGSLNTYHEAFHKRRKKLARAIVINRVLRSSRKIFVTSEMEKSNLPNVLNSKAVVVGLGIRDLEQFDFDPSLENPSISLLCMGRITRKKQYEMVIEAMLEIQKVLPSAKLVIAGDGEPDYLEELMARTRVLGLAEKVSFEGWVDGVRKIALVKASTIFLLPSLDENFGIVVAECLAAGVPCIVSRHVALQEIIGEYKAGIVLDEISPHSISIAVRKILESDISQTKLRAHTAAVENFSWSTVVRKWQNELELINLDR